LLLLLLLFNDYYKIDNTILPLFIQHSVRIAYVEDPRDYRNMFYKPEDLCKDIFEPMDSIAYVLLEFDSEKTANYIYNCFENDRKKNISSFVVKKRFRNFRKFNNNNTNGARNNNNNTVNGIDNKNKYNKHYNKNYQNSAKKDKNKFNRKSNSNFNFNHNNAFNNNTANLNNNNNTIYNENNHKNNYRNKNNHYSMDNNKNNNRKSFSKIIATPPDTGNIFNTLISFYIIYISYNNN